MAKYYTTTDAANYLGVSPSRIRQLITDGRLKSEKYGRDHLLEEAALQQFNEAGRKRRGRPKKSLRKR